MISSRYCVPCSCAFATPSSARQALTCASSVTDVLGDFEGTTYGSAGAKNDKSILCDAPGSSKACPPDGPQKFQDRKGDILFPIDSTFGFHVTDFKGAVEKKRGDGIWGEGFAGNIEENGKIIGVKVSNARTDKYKVPHPLGTWCAGMGATAIKCSTDHYTNMEHVLSCHEVVPYNFADAYYPFEQSSDCEELDNALYFPDGITQPSVDLSDLKPNENTNLIDIVYSTDYSVTKKADGRVLYRWGTLVKKPNDVRLYAKLTLPNVWKDRDSSGNLKNDFKVSKAHLIIEHSITNNPNDQIRPEDLENEGATGRKPGYKVVSNGSWQSIKDCVEADGNLIAAGTVLKQADCDFRLQGFCPPASYSKDLQEYFSNAWYTTIDRDPFEWSYQNINTAEDVHEFLGRSSPYNDTEEQLYNVSLVSGPRWVLKANKFGQDIPGLAIPTIPCSSPPFVHDNIKYNVGDQTRTVINLLDWKDDAGPSPLRSSKGWVDVDLNNQVKTTLVDSVRVSTNGIPMTEDFDLAIYIKGDRKPITIFSARLEITFEGEDPPT